MFFVFFELLKKNNFEMCVYFFDLSFGDVFYSPKVLYRVCVPFPFFCNVPISFIGASFLFHVFQVFVLILLFW